VLPIDTPLYPAFLRVIGLFFLLGSLATAGGCMKLVSSAGFTSSASLASSVVSSEILASPFRSSSRSSSGQQQDEELKEEIEIYTASYLATGGGSQSSFQLGLADIAARRGISDWEANPNTWVGVGRGLANADLGAHTAAHYADFWSDGSPLIVALLQQGYASGSDH
jgi:hypothetical protein